MAHKNHILSYNDETPNKLFKKINFSEISIFRPYISHTTHNLSLDKYKDIKFNFYLYNNHRKCAAAMMNFAKCFSNKEMIEVKPNQRIKYDGIPVIWGNKNASIDLIHQCWEDKVDFFHFDLAYLDNWGSKDKATSINTFRLSINRLHKNKIFPRPDDRARRLLAYLNANLHPYRNFDSNIILIIPPSEAMAEFYSIDIDFWLDNAIEEIKNNGFDYKIRFKPQSRQQRYTLKNDLNEVRALYAYNSNACVEALLFGIPVISNNNSAANPVNITFNQLKENILPDRNKWFNNISYSQWHMHELRSGLALRYTLEEYDLYKY